MNNVVFLVAEDEYFCNLIRLTLATMPHGCV